ncbi:hypothetical protein PC0870_15240 [Streptococcus pneumoniae]|nr:hypothetical protein PC1044_04200 [Streptococcus pneumoniae]GKW56459.1 hypothetical protein PC0870_15240 [Streptococcus pneumoniae]
MSLFIIGHMGLFFYNKIGSIISIVDLPTTNIIEPFFLLTKVVKTYTIKYYKEENRRKTWLSQTLKK